MNLIDVQRDWRQTVERIRREQHFSPWLRQALESVLVRDPLTCANDTELLAAIVRGRSNEICCGDPSGSPLRPPPLDLSHPRRPRG